MGLQIIKNMDRVLFYRQEAEPRRCECIKEVLESAGKRYCKIRADIEVLESEHAAIVKHIKSFPDWEYFIDNFAKEESPYAFGLFNSVQVYKTDDAEMVSLFYMPSYNRHDQNNIYFGNCTFDDILNIEEIIRKRKEYYVKTKKDV